MHVFAETTIVVTQINDEWAFLAFQRCIPEFENAAFNLPIDATNTCGIEEDTDFCVQTGFSNRKSCDVCRWVLIAYCATSWCNCSIWHFILFYREGDHAADRLSDLHDPKSPTWWQSETIYEGIQYPTAVNLTLNLGRFLSHSLIKQAF